MRKICFFFMVTMICLVTVVNSVEAHNMSVYLRNAWTAYENWEGRLSAGVSLLNKLEGKMDNLYDKWSDNNEDIRAGYLSALSSIGGLDVTDFVKSAVELELDISESSTLEGAFIVLLGKSIQYIAQ